MNYLSESQEEIVTSLIGLPIQVLASAGSGKTRVLTERIRFILDSTKRDGVIALTFTNKAAEEMQDRLSDLIDIDDRAWISTIHSIAQKILDQYGHTIGLPSELHIYDRDKDRMAVFLQSLRDDGVNIDEYLDVDDSKEQKNRQKLMQEYMDIFSLIKRNMLSEEDILDKYSDDGRIWKIYQDYQSALLESGGIDYDDILINAHSILLNHDWVANIFRAKYKHVCVDEAQDLNKAQYEFIKIFCGNSLTSLLMVGDPNQMIYGFNGSSSNYLCQQFISDFEPLKFVLTENYRSSKSIIKAANKLRPGSQTVIDAALEGIVVIQAMPNEFAEATWIVNQIKAILDLKEHDDIEGEISLGHMVVIARSQFIFPALEAELKNCNIPYHLKKSERKNDASSLFGKILDYAIKLKINPKDWVDGKKLCSLLKLNPPEIWGDENLLGQWSKILDETDIIFPELQSSLLLEIQELDLEEPNIRKFTKELERKIRDSVWDLEDDELSAELERSLSELNEFKRSWTLFRKKGLGESLQAFRNSMALGKLSGDFVGNGLTLSTVHTMKGLEKDIVFLIGMCEGLFPDYRAKYDKDINEERNNAFVAITRAKRWLYLTYPEKRTMPWGDVRSQKPSRFIGEIT